MADVFREPPPTARGQRAVIIDLLREAARRGEGVAGDALRHVHRIPQAPARIFELKKTGFRIRTEQHPVTRLAMYFLEGEPNMSGPSSPSSDEPGEPSASPSDESPDSYSAESERLRAQVTPLFASTGDQERGE